PKGASACPELAVAWPGWCDDIVGSPCPIPSVRTLSGDRTGWPSLREREPRRRAETRRGVIEIGVLQRFEQGLENAVTGAFARAFRAAVQPVEIAAALQRYIDNSAQVLSRQRMLVPNEFIVELSESDYERLSPYGGTLSDELARLVKEHVADQRYTM